MIRGRCAPAVPRNGSKARERMETFRTGVFPPVPLSRLQPAQGPEVSDGE